jgi:hypothetical protein
MYWYYPVTKRKPGATVLMVHPEAKLPKSDVRPPDGQPDAEEDPDRDRMPLIVSQNVGRGRVLYLGIEESWRWLFNRDDEHDHFARFWGQAVYAVGLSVDLPERRTQLYLSQTEAEKDERKKSMVYARLYDDQFQPLKDPEVQALLRQEPGPDNDPVPIVLKKTDQEGWYQAEVPNDRVGRFSITLQRGDSESTLDYRVRPSRKDKTALLEEAEMEPGLQEDLLRRAARAAGTEELFREEGLAEMLKKIQPKEVEFERRRPVTLWNWAALVLFTGLVSLEWLIRKFSNLS